MKIIDINNILSSVIIGILISITFFSFIFFNIIFLKQKYNDFNKNKLKRYIFHLLLGILTSLISPIFFLISFNLNSYYLLLSQLIIYYLVSIFISNVILIGVLPIFLSVNIVELLKLQNIYENQLLLYMSVFYIFIFLFTIFNKNIIKNKTVDLFIKTIFLFLFSILSSYFIFNRNLFYNYLIVNIFNFILFIILYTISMYLQNLIIKTFKLKTIIEYDNEFFVNNGYSELAIKNFVKKNKIQKAMVLKINLIQNKNNDAINKEFLKKIKNHFQDSVLYFKTYNNDFGFFIPIKDYSNASILSDKKTRKENTTDVQKIIQNIRKNVENLFEKKMKIKCLSIFYGIDFCDIKKVLINLDNPLFFEQSKKMIKEFKYDVKKNDIEKIESKIIIDNLKLNEVELCLDEIVVYNFSKRENQKYIKCSLYTNDDNLKLSDYLKKIKNEKIKMYVIRNFAYRSILLYSKIKNIKRQNYKLIVDYSIRYLENDSFNIKTIKEKILDLKLNPYDIILNFDFNGYNDMYIEPCFYKNLKMLTMEGFKISIENFDKNKIINFSKISVIFDFVFLKNRKKINNVSKNKRTEILII